MIAGMDSPERIPIVPSSDCQASPFFHFLCSLSPIKPVKPSFAAHACSELSFPPPPPIFVSPKADNSHKDHLRSRRKIFTGISDTAAKDIIDGFDAEECSLLPSDFQDDIARSLDQVAECNGSNDSRRTNEFGMARRDEAASTGAEELENPPKIEGKSISHPEKAGPIQTSRSGFANELTVKQASERDTAATSNPHESVSDGNNMAVYRSSNSEHVQKSMKASSWPCIPTGQLTRVLAPTRDLVEEDNAPTANLTREACKATNLIDENEALHDKRKEQVPRVGSTGARRRCLDFETLNTPPKDLEDFPVLRMLTDKAIFSERSEDIASQTGFRCIHEGSNMSLLNLLPGAYTSNSPGFTPTIDALYLPFQSKLGLVSENPDDSRTPQTKDPIRFHSVGLPYEAQLLASNRCDSSITAAIDQCSSHVPVDGCSAIKAIHSQGTDYDKDSFHMHAERELSLAETIMTDQKGEKTQSMNSGQRPAVHYALLSNIQSIESHDATESKNDFPSDRSTDEVLLQDIRHQSESENAEDVSHSPRKKRKLAIQAADLTGEGCKNCKCKKSKCLKLYCECFAAGVYCVDFCNCTHCFNKPEFEETVLETRQQIESRNPLAFLPKIIRAVESTPVVGEDCVDTPRSARHKRGCNCKKSQCLKKYCECYQAGVGCADGCRCEGCRNIFGRNEDPAETDGKAQRTASPEKESRTNEEIIAIDSWPTPEHEPQRYTSAPSPITPYLGHSGQCNIYVESVSTRKISSPFTPSVPTTSFDTPCRLLDSSDEFQSLEQMQLNIKCNFTDGTNKINDFGGSSNDWNSSRDIYSLEKPLPQLSPGAAGIVLDEVNVCQDWLKHGHSISNSCFQLPNLTSQESGQSSFLEQLAPLIFPSDIYHFQTSEETLKLPVTPMLPSSLPRRNYNLEETPDTPLLPSVWISDEEKSPNILKDSNSLSAPEIILKTRSPQQKRVFSHQNSRKGSHLKDIFSSRLGLKNGRRFILQSLPSSTSPDNLHRA